MNSCVAGLPADLRTLTLYAHLVPVFITLFLCIYALIRTRASRLAVIFAAFGFSVSLWLIGDLISWGVFPDYYVIYFFWSWLDFVNIVFFAFGAFFFGVLARETVPVWEKVLFLLLCIPGFFITATGHSVIEFTQATCEAANSDWLTNYKLFAEGFAVLLMLFSYVVAWRKSDGKKRVQLSIVLLAILLFFSVFAGTEYISSVTGNYNINLYGLFVLPLFLIIMVFSVTNLGVFDFRFLGTQILSYTLILMSGSQLLFVQDTTHTTLSVITLAISIFFGVLLLQNARNEEKARFRIEALARDLDKANKEQVVLLHFITHQIKGFLTKSRNIFSLLKEGDYGVLPETAKPAIDEGFNSDTKGVDTIQEILNAANIKSGRVTYTKAPIDLGALVKEVAQDLIPAANQKNLSVSLDFADEPYMLNGDRAQLTQVVRNLIDNSIHYTPGAGPMADGVPPAGHINVSLKKAQGKLIFEVSDTGVGITPEDREHLFTEGGHGKDSQKINVESTGFGLYIVKNIVEAHGGTIRAESEGAGKGSQFIVELPA